MSVLSITKMPEHLPAQQPADFREVTVFEVVSSLVGHTVDEVERELVLCTLDHYHGNRTRSATVLGISVRCMRNKIHEYEEQGIAVPVHH